MGWKIAKLWNCLISVLGRYAIMHHAAKAPSLWNSIICFLPGNMDLHHYIIAFHRVAGFDYRFVKSKQIPHVNLESLLLLLQSRCCGFKDLKPQQFRSAWPKISKRYKDSRAGPDNRAHQENCKFLSRLINGGHPMEVVGQPFLVLKNRPKKRPKRDKDTDHPFEF